MQLTSTQARNQAHANIQNLSQKQKTVFQTIKLHGPMTSKEVAEFLNWDPNQVTGRIAELRDEEILIKQHGNKKAGRNTVCTWSTFENPEDRMEGIYRARRDLKEVVEELELSGHGLSNGAALELIKSSIKKLKIRLKKIEQL